MAENDTGGGINDTATQETAQVAAQQADFEELASASGEGKKETEKNIEFLLDIPLEVTVKLGHARMIIKDLLSLSQGSVIELDKLAGEPMDIFVNDKMIARGEVVVVNEKFGIRLTDILSPTERLKQLG